MKTKAKGYWFFQLFRVFSLLCRFLLFLVRPWAQNILEEIGLKFLEISCQSCPCLRGTSSLQVSPIWTRVSHFWNAQRSGTGFSNRLQMGGKPWDLSCWDQSWDRPGLPRGVGEGMMMGLWAWGAAATGNSVCFSQEASLPLLQA